MGPFKYSWQIPTTSTCYFDLICCGYCRDAIPIMELNVFRNIVDLCINYLNRSDILNDIKTASFEEAIHGPLFYHAFCKWMIEFYPRGSEINGIEVSRIYLSLLSVSPKIRNIECECTLYIAELNFNVDKTLISLSANSRYIDFNCDETLKPEAFHNLERLTFDLELNILKITNEDQETLQIDNTLQVLSNKHITDNFKWIFFTENPESALFTMHSLSWCLELIPEPQWQRETGLCRLKLLSLPCNAKVYVHYDLICKDVEFRQSELALFQDWSLTQSIDNKALSRNNIKNMKYITIDLMIILIDIFDDKGNNITNRYIDNHQSPKHLIPIHHQWRIPTISRNDILFLCNGYIREQCINIYIPYDISSLITLFFDDGKVVVDEIKNAKNKKGFKSDIFKIGGFKWYLDVYPRGYGAESEEIESYLNIVSLSTNILGITCWYKWKMYEMNVFNEGKHTFMSTSLSTNVAGIKLFVADIQNVESLTFELDLFITDIVDQNGICLDDYQKYQDHSIINKYIDSFEWKIDEESMNNMEENVMSDEFNMHLLKWRLQLMEKDGFEVQLSLIYLPSNLRIWINIILQIEDSDVIFQSEGVEIFDKNMYETISLSLDFVPNRDITFKLIIELMDVYDENGYCITQEYWNQNWLNDNNQS